MVYLSKILHKDLLHEDKSYGKIMDLVVSQTQKPYVSKVVVKRGKTKFIIPADAIKVTDSGVELKKIEVAKLPYEEKDFLLGEDILDKQVIDINGRRLVRVNDILLKNNGILEIEGIDIGMSGI